MAIGRFSCKLQGDITVCGDSFSFGLWTATFRNFFFKATVSMSEVSLLDMRLCRLNGVPPGERLTGVLRSSDLQPFLILLRSSSLAWLCGVLGFFVVDILLFLKRVLDSLSAVPFLFVSGVRGGGGGGGGISICGGRGAVETPPVLFVVTSMLFLLQ